jgi:sugar-specific transcriptional regulator TrmB
MSDYKAVVANENMDYVASPSGELLLFFPEKYHAYNVAILLNEETKPLQAEITKLQSANAELLQQLEAEREEKGRLSQALSEIKEVTGGVKVSDYAYPIFSFVSDIYAILGELENESTSATEVVE